MLRHGALDLLRRRELLRIAGQLSDELGIAFVEHHDGERITGIYRRAVDTLGGRYALVERSREFSLAPWKPMLEHQIGREVSGTLSRGAVDWTIGRGRGQER